MAKDKKSLSEAVSKELKSNFNLNTFKSNKGLNSSVKFKDQEWIPLSNAFSEVLSIPGIPLGQITLLRGNTDTGKTTALLETAIAAQTRGILPVFIITEMKWSWEHVRMMGFDVEEIVDEDTGEIIDYTGNFIYVDRETLHTIEDVAAFMLDLMDEQKKGSLPYDLLFLWDSIGSIPCEQSVKSNKNNNEWNAGAMSTQFSDVVNQKIVMSRKQSSPFTNTLVCVNKVWTKKAVNAMAQPKLMNKGGFAMWYDAAIIITFGNVADSGTSKIKAILGGKQVEFAKRTNIQCDKNHINGMQSRGKIITTPHGFIGDDDKFLKEYKNEHSAEWKEILGGTNFNIVVEESTESTMEVFTQEPE
tara:strand:- start:2602 stop:3678 length:1077 start_codon:yes stop_codon:yes gene_type:complete